MHLPRISTSKRQKIRNKSGPSWRLFRVVARCKMRPAGPNRSSAPHSLKQIHGAQGTTEERCSAPHPCAGVDATRATAQLLSRRRSWPIPPANCAEAAHDRRKCVIRTRDKSFLSRPVCFKQLLVLVMPIISPKGCESSALEHFPSLRLWSLANIQPFRESQSVACLGCRGST